MGRNGRGQGGNHGRDFLVILGCAGCGEGRQNAQEASSFVPAYQFAPGFGIIAHSPYQVYVLENESGYSVSRNGVTVELVRGMLQNNEMVAELRILDYRKNRMENDMEAGSRSFDMRCFGPGIPDMGYTAERMGTHSENHDAGDAGYREILAEFCTTSKKIDTEKGLAGYYFQIDGLDETWNFPGLRPKATSRFRIWKGLSGMRTDGWCQERFRQEKRGWQWSFMRSAKTSVNS